MARGKKTGGRQPGSLNKRTAAIEAAAQAVAVRFKAEVPTAFDGDGVAYLQVVYRDPRQPVELRIDCAKAASRFERPALAATLTKEIDSTPTDPDEIDRLLRERLERIRGGYKVIEG